MVSARASGWLANAVLVAHFAFVLFVVFGGLGVLRWPRVAFAHVPAVAWGVWIELAGWICPLTPLENALRRRAGEQGYEGDFIARYVTSVIYPANLTRTTQIALGIVALALNAAIYAVVLQRLRRARDTSAASPNRNS